jgi:carbonic anhydrase
MPAPSISANDSTTAGLWAFDRSEAWTARYGNCSNKAKRTAPLNIDTTKVSPCNALCRFAIQYAPSTCSVSMINNIPTVRFSPNCIAKFKNEFFYLSKMTIHHTSMHTLNNSYADLELLLYHNRNPINDSDGGIIVSVLLKKGNDYGTANEFLNEFINQMPSNEMPIEQDVTVSDSWNPEQLLPESKSFFYYDGALPYPPCSQNWTIIIFEEIVQVSLNIIDTVQYMIGPGNKNIRPTQRKPKNISIFYNSNSRLDSTQDLSNSALEAATTTTIPLVLRQESWLKKNIYFIKGVVIVIILILMIYVAIKFAKIIVENDLLNSFIVRQLKKKQHKEAEHAKEELAKQQAAEYGGVAPVANVAMNNNNDNDNNNN